jgi:hypothetical protein
MLEVTHGMQVVLMEKGSGSLSSAAKTHVWPHATLLLRFRRVWHAAGGAVVHAVSQAFCSDRDVDVIVECFVVERYDCVIELRVTDSFLVY